MKTTKTNSKTKTASKKKVGGGVTVSRSKGSRSLSEIISGGETPMSLQESLDALPSEELARVEERANELISEEKALRELRAARAMSQVQLAKRLGVKQAEISKMERRTDMYISTLRDYVEALGGSLSIVAEFPVGSAKIKHLGSKPRRGR